ncbi:MAG TPA: 2-oxoacid:ferredoxin oxidoreductase subunit beta [Planctomycetota bacterium]|nr:2-oxoacid:ferredoxin oxidoreductase subunit beta [Planctomycetota bacterium]
MSPEAPVLDKKHFESDQQVRWCPGCGDYAILSSMTKAFAEIGVPREKIAIVSGIGCAARFPYYVNTYGFHTIHGRAPAIATGLKVARPDLHVWVVGGDGDILSIGGNHFLHALRRNVTLKILCFDNRIYGLTKGQTSPTSEYGKVTKTTPMGSLDRPVNPISLAIAAEATFVARTADKWNDHFRQVILAAAAHEGSAFVQILQNCVVFNEDSWEPVVGREERDEHALYLEHGKPLRFGRDREKGIRLDGSEPEVVTVGEGGVTEADLVVHDEKDEALAYLLSRLDLPRFPMPVGIFRRVEGFVPLEKGIARQREEAMKKKGKGDVMKLIHSGETWTVNG